MPTLATAQNLRAQGKHDEARNMLVTLADLHRDDAELQYETASVHDFLGHETLAIKYYLAALDGMLRPHSRRGAYLGLGSTYRALGKYSEAERILTSGLTEFPEAREIMVFLAMTWLNLGHSKPAVEALLTLLAETTSDEGIRQYAEAIAMYAQDIDRKWQE